VRRGHPWVFSNELIDKVGGVEPGEFVEVSDYTGRPVGVGYANPRTLIAVRMLSVRGEPLRPGFVRERVAAAKALREMLCPGRQAYRAVYSESDMLPGLIVDRYGGWLSVQVLTAGMERMLPEVMDALVGVHAPEGIVLRNDSPQRALEGLDAYTRVELGGLPESVRVNISGLDFEVDLLHGQKTGFFLDQADNYRLLDGISGGARVLDLFCHTGPWSLYAAAAGANSVVGVDSSKPALDRAAANAKLNGLEGKAGFVRSDAFDYLKGVPAGNESFDVVVCDPPAFIKSRAKIAEGLKGYRDLNVRAMKAVAKGGFIITASCSHHLDRSGFVELLRECAAGAKKSARLIELRSQSKDHPVLLAAPETEYLKCALLQLD
jgi:23S rRNA (cytosine1962-C5)-methyltransferase